MMLRAAVLLAALAFLLPAAAQAAPEPPLLAGVGRADITPPTGYVLGGWTRADRTGQGVHTRLNATAIVLQRGDRKVALVSVDLFMVAGGMLKEAAERNADLGFDERNVLASASHTHAGPGGYANFTTFNTTAPGLATIGRPQTFVELLNPAPADPRLYTFLTEQLAKAIRRAAENVGPAAAGWGETQLTDVTRNRSLEAHLADHGVLKERGHGHVEDDPDGALHTIDPEVHVLRVDRLVRRRGREERVPLGGWLSFANHGTVNPSEYQVYNNDHHAAATRVFEERVRAAGSVPLDQPVVGVYGNGNEGDQSAGLDGQGPARAEWVGRREADAMVGAWEQAGRAMSTTPALDLRWTRTCFCGQDVGGGRKVATEPAPGLPFLTGSEEGRGPLFDITHVPFEGVRVPVDGFTSQGHKLFAPGLASTKTVPQAVPLMTVRVGDRVIASLPGEPTVEVGRRVKAAVLDGAAGAGVSRVIVSGLANEFIQYLTTPEEYARQHYEGGSTLYGPYAAELLTQQLGELARRMAAGVPAQEPHALDPRNGVRADGPAYPDGAAAGLIVGQPKPAIRGGDANVRWQGGPGGYDRPVDTPFVTVERAVAAGRGAPRWERVTDDLGLRIIWRIDADGYYTATWQVPADAQPGTYRFVVTAKRYRLDPTPFRVG